MSHREIRGLEEAREFLPGRLYFLTSDRAPIANPQVHYFSISNVFVYMHFYLDFGPNCIAHIIRFCDLINGKLNHPELKDKKICLFSTNENAKRCNAAFLICAYMLIVHRRVPEEAFKPLLGMGGPFIPYRDAGYGQATYHITIPDCLRGLNKALQIGLFNLDTFNLEEYEFYERVENGDMNWISDKFLALASPKDNPNQQHNYGLRNRQSGYSNWAFFGNQEEPEIPGRPKFICAYYMNELAELLHQKGVSTIIHLNKEQYSIEPLTEKGIEHIDMYFPDGTTPPEHLLLKFLDIVENRPGPIAIHCKAGLGRTGTLIACYLMKHYLLTAAEVISYLRLIRPGSVVGPQQNFLQGLQNRLWQMHPNQALAEKFSVLHKTAWPECNRYPMADIVPLPQQQQFQQSQRQSSFSSTSSKVSYTQASPSPVIRQQSEEIVEEQLRIAAETAVPVQPRKDDQGRIEEENLRGLRSSRNSNNERTYQYQNGQSADGDRSSFIPRSANGSRLELDAQDEEQQYIATQNNTASYV